MFIYKLFMLVACRFRKCLLQNVNIILKFEYLVDFYFIVFFCCDLSLFAQINIRMDYVQEKPVNMVKN